jgi:flagellar hook-associated protein 2
VVSLSTGLISGMDTAGLIDSLIAVERNPQTLLKTKLADTKADATAYRAVNTKFDALRTAAEALTKAATWGAAKATSSSPAVAVTATSTAVPGSTSFTVDSVAARHTVVGTSAFDASAGLGLTIADRDGDAAPQTVTIAAGTSLADTVKAINAAGGGVTASIVGGDRLQLTATTTGADSAFDVTGGSFGTVVEGADAKVTVQGSGSYSFSATSTTNTFSDLLPGVTITVAATTTDPVTVEVASDPAAVADAVQSLVSAANAVLTSIAGYTDTKSGSIAVLKGDSTLRGLANKVLGAVSDAIGGTASAAQAGIQLTRYGTITFDKDAFTKALAADPTLTQSLVNGSSGTPAVPGVAQRLLDVVTEATDSVTGSLVVRAKSQDEAATSLQDRIDDWDRRLELRRSTLSAQFTAMETALSSLQNQSGWLSAQLKSLPSSS